MVYFTFSVVPNTVRLLKVAYPGVTFANGVIKTIDGGKRGQLDSYHFHQGHLLGAEWGSRAVFPPSKDFIVEPI